MERKLAHIEKIVSLSPIEGADKIEVAQVIGWQCVVKKGEFNIGDAVVYIEIDSILPEKPEYEFLRERKFRIKTIKLRGQVSQGLIIPLPKEFKNLPIGTDVTTELGITKYLSPSEKDDTIVRSRFKGNQNPVIKYLLRYKLFRKLIIKTIDNSFPYWVSKTDEERIQNLGDSFIQRYADSWVYVTEKIDYQSGTWTVKEVKRFSNWIGKIISIKKLLFVVASRNVRNVDKTSLYWQIANKYRLQKILSKPEFKSLTIQGEQGAPQVQGNKYGLNTTAMWVFNIINHASMYHYNHGEIVKFCNDNELTPVPFVTRCQMKDIGSTVKDFVEFSKGKSMLADIPREGVVIRCVAAGRKVFSFKVINPDFLLKYND